MNRRKAYLVSEAERDRQIEIIEAKWADGTPLTEDEKAFAVVHLKFEKLLLYSFGVDEFFTRTYFGLYHELSPMQDIAYNGLVREWESDVTKLNHPDPILQATSQETREELKKLGNDFIIASFNYTSQQYMRDKFDLLAWSKYRYLITKRIIEDEFKGNNFLLHLNGIEITVDQRSIAHIFARHYGQTMKPFISDKSHFSKDFYHEEIHLALQEVLKKIDDSGLYTHDSIQRITFRYNGTLYRIYCGPAKKSVKGAQGPIEYIRLITFFPLEDQKMLERLHSNYIEHKIDTQLSIFTTTIK